MTTLSRRGALTALGLTGLGFVASATALWRLPAQAEATKGFEITKTDEEWQKILSPDAFQVMRKHATERPFTSALLEEKREGVFACAGCELPLYASKTKYDSGTGWPSFWDALPNAVGTQEDNTLFVARTELHCRRCGGHLGHVFDDGPQPTGKRHCINGVSLAFVPGGATPS
jgi:peptide-methionine (R)-S-oxide reductase